MLGFPRKERARLKVLAAQLARLAGAHELVLTAGKPLLEEVAAEADDLKVADAVHEVVGEAVEGQLVEVAIR